MVPRVLNYLPDVRLDNDKWLTLEVLERQSSHLPASARCSTRDTGPQQLDEIINSGRLNEATG